MWVPQQFPANAREFSGRYLQVLGRLPVAEAVKTLKGFGGTKFDHSVEIAIRLGIDHTQADQSVRGSIVLPHGIGKQRRVVVFAKGAKADEAWLGDSFEPHVIPELDLRLTYAFLAHASDLLGWRSSPRRIDRNWLPAPKKADLLQHLRDALKGNQVGETCTENPDVIEKTCTEETVVPRDEVTGAPLGATPIYAGANGNGASGDGWANARGTADAIAQTATRVRAFDAEAVRDLLAADPVTAAQVYSLVLRCVSERLTTSWHQLLDLFGMRGVGPW